MRRLLWAMFFAFVVVAVFFVRWFIETANGAKGFSREPLVNRVIGPHRSDGLDLPNVEPCVGFPPTQRDEMRVGMRDGSTPS